VADDKLDEILDKMVELQMDGAGRLDTYTKIVDALDKKILKVELQLEGAIVDAKTAKKAVRGMPSYISKKTNELKVELTKTIDDLKADLKETIKIHIKNIKETQITLPKLLTYTALMAAVVSGVMAFLTWVYLVSNG